MEMLDNNQGKRLGDSLSATLDDDAKLSIISAHFSLFAYGELREELERLDSVRVLFNEPTFIRDMKRRLSTLEFDIAQRAQGQREKALAESSLELTLRNKLGGVWVFRTVCFERVVLSSPGCLWPGRMDDHEEVLEAHA